MILKEVIIIGALIAFTNAEYKSYKDYKVFQLVPNSEEDVKAINDLKESKEWYFWSDIIKVSGDVRIMVEPEKTQKLEDHLKSVGITSKIIIRDVQTLIDDQIRVSENINRNVAEYSWTYYQNLDEIYSWLDHFAAKHPGVVTLVTLGLSREERPIRGVKIDFRQRKDPVIGMIEGGIHAREWISPATVTWIIKELVESNDPDIRFLAENIVWHIFPVVNPDGYVYTFTHNRMWRKNRSTGNYTSCDHWNIDSDFSNGVDLNRNFGFVWMSTGASQDPCEEIYAGPVAFSEPEAAGIANYVLGLQQAGQLVYYFAFHSYTQLILVPFSHTGGSDVLSVPNYADMFEIAARGAEKIENVHGKDYVVGTSTDILYPVSGSSFDWVKGEAKVPVVFLFELRDIGPYGFLLPADQIIPNGEEVMAGLIEMDKTTRQLGYFYVSSAVSIGLSAVFLTLTVALVL